MNIDFEFPPVDKLKSLELKTFKYLCDCKVIKEEPGFSVLKNEAIIYFNALNSGKKLQKSHIDFQTYFDLQVQKEGWRFHIGSAIQNDYSLVSYYLAICSRHNDQCVIRRKFHFDYDIGQPNQRQDHPKYHVQYAGKNPTGMGDHGPLYEEILHSPLSEPRFPYTPMSLALLLNSVFVEFATEITSKIAEDNQWRDLILSHEKELLRPYYRNCCNLFHSGHSSKKLFTTDYCYGR